MDSNRLITYSREQLLSFASNGRKILRSHRKSLFQNRLWRPRGAQWKGLPGPPPRAVPAAPLRTLKIATWNACSLRQKYTMVADSLLENDLDVLVITETWHLANTDISLRRSSPPGYTFIDLPRSAQDKDGPLPTRGGGLAIFHKATMCTRTISLEWRPETFELLATSIISTYGPLTLLGIYRPGSCQIQSSFFKEFSMVLDFFALHNTQLIIMGDLNLHLQDKDSLHTTQFHDLLACYGLKQHVNKPTHRLGGWLDVIITRESCPVHVQVGAPILSDHGMVIADLPFLHDPPTYTRRQIRCWRQLDHEALTSAISSSSLCGDMSSLSLLSTTDLFEAYDQTMNNIVNSLLPIKSVTTKNVPLAPWFDSTCRKLRRDTRCLERKYRRSRSPGDKSIWISAVRSMHSSFREKESLYWSGFIKERSKNPRQLWNALNRLLGRLDGDGNTNSTNLPTATDFSHSFADKVRLVREETNSAPPPSYSTTDHTFSSLELVTPAEVRAMIIGSPPKSSELDPLPPVLIQENIDVLLPFFTLLVNRSLQEGTLPPAQKRAIVHPTVKQEGLDKNDTKNYRPIANLSFISKIIEKLLVKQLLTFLDSHKLLPVTQSGFRKGHSTETLLTRLLSDIYSAMDNSEITLLALFDISAAFDTVDHEILLKRLNTTFGISGKPLEWIASFLHERTYCIVLPDSRTSWIPYNFGLPQGSGLSPLLYILYTGDVSSILYLQHILSQLYADDTQAYTHCHASEASLALERMQQATKSLEEWLSSNRLRLNISKTKYIWIGNSRQLAKIDSDSLSARFPQISFCSSVRDLGVILDQELSFRKHINSVARSCNYQLRQLRIVSRSLSPESSAILVHAFICCRLDYCNAVYAGLPWSRLSVLSGILRAAARLIAGRPKYSHISHYMLTVLHWLPVESRIKFKLLKFAWNCRNCTAPDYLSDLCVQASTLLPGRRSLRSTSRNLLFVPYARTSLTQRRAFAITGPTLWNTLPDELRSSANTREKFQKDLKTYLFQNHNARSASG